LSGSSVHIRRFSLDNVANLADAASRRLEGSRSQDAAFRPIAIIFVIFGLRWLIGRPFAESSVLDIISVRSRILGCAEVGPGGTSGLFAPRHSSNCIACWIARDCAPTKLVRQGFGPVKVTDDRALHPAYRLLYNHFCRILLAAIWGA